MKNTRTTLLFIVSLLTTLGSLYAQMPKWAFGAHSTMGLSGSIRQETGSRLFLEQVSDFSGKEQLQTTYGGGLWLEHLLNNHWSIYTVMSFQQLKVLANSQLITDTPDLYYYTEYKSGWRSQYLQLSFSGRHYFGEEASNNRWFVGTGLLGVVVFQHIYQRAGDVIINSMPGSTANFIYYFSNKNVFIDNFKIRSDRELERSPVALGGRFELGLRINRWSLSLVNTAFLQKRRKGVPSYNDHTGLGNPNPNGPFTYSDIPLRYVRSATLHFAYQIK